MNYLKLKILFILCLANLFVLANNSDTVAMSNGFVYVKGEIYNRQIFLETNDTVIKLTNFESWEEIYDLYMSNDKEHLLIYHKTNKQRARKLSVMDMTSFKMIKTIEPGFGGSLQWTNSNNILQIWGCGSPCACFRLYDSQLKVILGECETSFNEFINEDIIVSLPGLSIQFEFKVWSLSTGNLLKKIDFREKYGDYYCWGAIINGDKLDVELTLLNSDKKIIEYIELKK